MRSAIVRLTSHGFKAARQTAWEPNATRVAAHREPRRRTRAEFLLVVLGRRSGPRFGLSISWPGNGILWAETGGRFQAQNA